MSGAIVPFRPVRLPALIELLGADVACTLRFAEHGRRRGGTRTCELVLANKAKVTVSGRLYGVDRRNRRCDFGELTVAANGLGASVFRLPAGAAACERISVEVIGDGIRLCADSRVIPNRPISAWPFVTASASVIAIGMIAFATAFLVERPTIDALGVPQSTAPGTVTAMYATSGRASGTYVATASDGSVLAAGVLPAANGDFPIAVPAKIAGQRVRVGLDLSGPFGHAERDVTFAVVGALPEVAPPRPANRVAPHVPRARIAYFGAHLEQYAGKTSVLASYQASGERGSLRVRDERGMVLATRDFSHVGTTRIPLPANPAGQTLRAEIEVIGAGTRSTAVIEIPSIEIPSVPKPDSAPPSATPAPADDGGSVPLPSDPFFVEQRVVAGREFKIEIRRPLPNLRIGLQTTSGTTLDEVAVPPGARAITLRAPSSSVLEIYYLAGTFTRSSGEETLVRSLRIYPD
jgi:hypothetical protein